MNILPYHFMAKMYPDPEAHASKYPSGTCFQLWDVLKENELRHPTMLNTNGEECLLVVKNSKSTSVTIGHATSIMSFVQEYFEDDVHGAAHLPVWHQGQHLLCPR